MFIYILFKVIFNVIGSYFKMDVKKGFLVLELVLVLLYCFLLYHDFIKLNIGLLLWLLMWISFISSYKIINHILINRSLILFQLKKNTNAEQINVIKRFFMQPFILNLVYYGIWLLPWNVLYYIYFLIMEHGWYYRVWFVSFRDIFFLRFFRWDSRIFFFKLNERISKNKILSSFYLLKEKMVKAFLRIFILISIMKKKFLDSSIKEFFMGRLIIFCYLSLFYLYVIDGILLLNVWLFYIIILIEIIILFFFDDIVFFFLKKDLNSENDKYLNLLFLILKKENLQILLDPLNLTYYEQAKSVFEQNNMVWNKILGNSLSLNILYEFILYANKNTNGYYYHFLGISTRIRSKKLYDLSGLPWDILPATTFVVMSMRYIQHNVGLEILPDGKEQSHYDVDLINMIKSEDPLAAERFADTLKRFPKYLPDYRIKAKKNLYLSIYEKTYLDNTLLITIFLLKINYEIVYSLFYSRYYHILIKDNKLDKNFFFLNSRLNDLTWSKIQLWKSKLIDINIRNPELLRVEYILNLFKFEKQFLDISSDYLVRIHTSGIDVPVLNPDQEFCGLSKYKSNIKLLSKLRLFEEEALVWNDDLLKYLDFIEKSKKNIDYTNSLIEINELFSKFARAISITWRYSSQDQLKESMVNEFGIVFNKQLDLNSFPDFNFDDCLILKHLGYKVDKMNCVFLENCTIIEESYNIIKDFESISNKNFYELRWSDGTLRAVWDEDSFNKQYENFIKSIK